MKNHSIGSGPVDPEYADKMRAIARGIDEFLNGPAPMKDPKNGFILMMFPLGHHKGRCNYMSNANREDVVVMLKEQLAYFEGQSDVLADNTTTN